MEIPDILELEAILLFTLCNDYLSSKKFLRKGGSLFSFLLLKIFFLFVFKS